MEELKYDDKVIFRVNGKVFTYEVQQNWLKLDGDSNNRIFQELGVIDARHQIASDAYGYKAGGGDWPTYNTCDYAAATRLVEKLQQMIAEKEGVSGVVSTNYQHNDNFTFYHKGRAYIYANVDDCFISNVGGGDNELIFRVLGLDKVQVCKECYRTTPGSGDCPTTPRDNAAVNRLIAYLFSKCDGVKPDEETSKEESPLDRARREYPIGTMYIPLNDYGEDYSTSYESYYEPNEFGSGNIEVGPGYIYVKGINKWATIVKDEKEEKKDMLAILEEAKRRYPIGTKYSCAAGDGYEFTVTEQNFSIPSDPDTIYGETSKGCLYHEGKWAEIISQAPKPSPDDEIRESILRRYPVGTAFRPAHVKHDHSSICIVTEDSILERTGGYWYFSIKGGRVCVLDPSKEPQYGNTNVNRVVYTDGKYAAIVENPSTPTPKEEPKLQLLKEKKFGVRVRRSPDWEWDNQDGGDGNLGTTVEGTDSHGWVSVRWDKGRKESYRVGSQGKYDLYIVEDAPIVHKYKVGDEVRLTEECVCVSKDTIAKVTALCTTDGLPSYSLHQWAGEFPESKLSADLVPEQTSHKFKVGDIVIGNYKADTYGCTRKGWKGKVTYVKEKTFTAVNLPDSYEGEFPGLDYDDFDLFEPSRIVSSQDDSVRFLDTEGKVIAQVSFATPVLQGFRKPSVATEIKTLPFRRI